MGLTVARVLFVKDGGEEGWKEKIGESLNFVRPNDSKVCLEGVYLGVLEVVLDGQEITCSDF
jgi:hypothetical protein